MSDESNKHLDESGESYWEHFRYASTLGLRLARTSVYILIHAVFPEWKRFDNAVLPFLEEAKKELVVRQMRTVHYRLTKRLEKRLRENLVEEDSLTDDL